MTPLVAALAKTSTSTSKRGPSDDSPPSRTEAPIPAPSATCGPASSSFSHRYPAGGICEHVRRFLTEASISNLVLRQSSARGPPHTPRRTSSRGRRPVSGHTCHLLVLVRFDSLLVLVLLVVVEPVTAYLDGTHASGRYLGAVVVLASIAAGGRQRRASVHTDQCKRSRSV